MGSMLLIFKQLLQDSSAATVFFVTKSVQLDQISDSEAERENDI